MPKPMINRTGSANRSDNVLSASYEAPKKKAQTIDKVTLDRMLRQPRSKQYMDAMTKLDAGGHTHNQNQVNDIIDAIRNEFPEVEITGVLLGFVSKCYLGAPYEVHTLDMTGNIIEHYKAGQTLPGGLEKARAVAIRGSYSFIEVYVDCCRCVSANGTVSVVPC